MWIILMSFGNIWKLSKWYSLTFVMFWCYKWVKYSHNVVFMSQSVSYCPSKLTWKIKVKRFCANIVCRLTDCIIVWKSMVYVQKSINFPIEKYTVRMATYEMFLVFNWQLRWFDNKSSYCPPLKYNVTKRVHSYFTWTLSG